MLLPAGAAWRAAWRREARLELPTGRTASTRDELGTALAALVVYAGLTGTDPGELPVDADDDDASVLRPRPPRRSRPPDDDVLTR